MCVCVCVCVRERERVLKCVCVCVHVCNVCNVCEIYRERVEIFKDRDLKTTTSRFRSHVLSTTENSPHSCKLANTLYVSVQHEFCVRTI